MYIYLDIVEGFVCEMCGACCRNDWQVTLNEESYSRNQQLFAAKGRVEEFAEAFIRLPAGGYGEYACIAKRDGKCWFLAQDLSCALQREAGHEHLDAVCQLFPRYPMDTARGTEITLSFSCPAVLKLAVRRRLELKRSAEAPTAVIAGHETEYVYPQQQPASRLQHYYFELEQHIIDLLQGRWGTLPQRLEMVLDYMKKAAALAGEERGQQVAELNRQGYRVLDELEAAAVPREELPGELLLENFLVSFIFKKPIYSYGVAKVSKLLTVIGDKAAAVWETAGEEQFEAVQRIIAEVEFTYSHHRQALLETVKE